MNKKKSIIVLGCVLGAVILAVAIYMFWPKNDKPITDETLVEESYFDVSIFDMDKGYIADSELLERIRLECYPYAEELDAETAFYTNDGIELYAYVRPDRYQKVVIYLNLDEDIIDYEVADEIPSEDIN